MTLLHGCSHFGHVFALNRYLALLLARLHALQLGEKLPSVLLAQTRLHRVDAAPPHVCGEAAQCHGVPHEVWVQPQTCGSHAPAEPYLLGSFDIVLVRHGPGANRLLGAPMVAEHLVPRQPV